MPIDIMSETVLAIKDVARFLAEKGILNKFGRPYSYRTVKHWVEIGILDVAEPLAVGRRYTSEQAVARMLAGETKKPRRVDRRTRERKQRERTSGAEWAKDFWRARGFEY